MKRQQYPITRANSLLLDSKNYSSFTGGVYTFELKNDIKDIKAFRFSIRSFPATMYTIAGATSISAFANNVVQTSLGNATIPSGNYNATTLAAALQVQLKLVDVNFTAVYTALTNTFTIANTSPFTITMPGYSSYTFGIDTNSTPALSFTSTFAPTLTRTKYITLHSGILSKYIQINRHTDFRTYFVSTFPMAGTVGDDIFYEQNNPNWYEFSDKRDRISTIDIQFRDEYGEIVDFNGAEWFIQLEFLPSDESFINYL